MKNRKPNNKATSGKSSRPKKNNRRTYTPISDALAQPQVFADTELADGIRRHGLINLFAQAFRKLRRRDSEPLSGILLALLTWPILKASSIHCFCSELCQYLRGRKDDSQRRQDILYGVLGREDINWRQQSLALAQSVAKQNDLGPVNRRAFVVDDSLKNRRGRKVEGASRHWDHTEGRTVFGHQVVEFGMAGETGYLPVDRQLFIGAKDAVEKPADKDFHDKRSAAARDMNRAKEECKHTMLRRMLKKAVGMGLKAKYLLGDAWFGCKENIEAAVQNGLSAIFQMKRGFLQYWVGNPETGVGRYYTAKQLYVKYKRQLKRGDKNTPYKTCRIKAWLNLETNPNKEERWQEVILILSSANSDGSDSNWVIFLCTDMEARAEEVLAIYALRWSIEVYFKEIKQNFGFLAEQSGRYQFAYASIHLAALRYTLLFEAMLRSGGLSFGEMRDKQTGRLQVLSYAGLLWQLFRGIIEGALDAIVESVGGETIDRVLGAIDQAVESFLNQALQIDSKLVQSQIRAESIGHL